MDWGGHEDRPWPQHRSLFTALRKLHNVALCLYSLFCCTTCPQDGIATWGRLDLLCPPDNTCAQVFWILGILGVFVLGAKHNPCRRWCRDMSPVLVPRCFNPQAQNPDISFLKASPFAIPKDLYSHSNLSGFPSASAGFMYSRGQLDILSKGFEPMLCAQGWSAAHRGFLPIW